jgi:hydroxymethylbilane synthase
MKTLTVATRKSPLALAQARAWLRSLESPELEIVELHVTTTGDRIQDRALSEVGGKGLFIKEIEEALLDKRADIAIHSLKDVPAELAPGLSIACVPPREDPRDVIFTAGGSSFLELPRGAKVGTSSLRRMVQLRAARPDLEFVPIRGNVDTRLRRCEEGVVDAVVLAFAGLKRLGLAERATVVIEPELCLPAIGQGALAIECRSDDASTKALLAPHEDVETARLVAAERGVMHAVEGNCQIPVAGYAIREHDGIWLRAMLAEADGSHLRRRELRAAWPSSVAAAFELGVALGTELKQD